MNTYTTINGNHEFRRLLRRAAGIISLDFLSLFPACALDPTARSFGIASFFILMALWLWHWREALKALERAWIGKEMPRLPRMAKRGLQTVAPLIALSMVGIAFIPLAGIENEPLQKACCAIAYVSYFTEATVFAVTSDLVSKLITPIERTLQ